MPAFTDGKLRCGQNTQRNSHFANIPWSSQNASFVLIRFPCQRILLRASQILRAVRWRWESRAHISRVEIRVSFFHLRSFVVQSRQFLMCTNQNSYFVTLLACAGLRVRPWCTSPSRKHKVYVGRRKIRLRWGPMEVRTR